VTKLTLYRLIPHAPFTISNYLLGLTRVPLPLFMGSTALGLAPWCAFYALVGSAGNAFVAGSLGDATSVVLIGADMAIAAAMGVLLLAAPLKATMARVDAFQG
jgi:sulfoquinovosyltransferase